MSWDGKVTETFTDRLHRAARNGTGYLEVHDTTRKRRGWVFLEDQDVVALLVDGYQPRLARRLTASRLVSVADMSEVLTVAKDEYDPRIAVECVARGLVDAVTMKVLYREFMLSAASFVDEWELGDSQWVAGVPPWEGRSTAVSGPAAGQRHDPPEGTLGPPVDGPVNGDDPRSGAGQNRSGRLPAGNPRRGRCPSGGRR